MTILEDYYAFIKENSELIEIIFKNSPSIRSWIEPAMFIVNNADQNDDLDEQTVDFACDYVMDKIDIITYLDDVFFKGDFDKIADNSKNICCLFHLTDMILEKYRVENELFAQRIIELEELIFKFIEEGKVFDTDFQLKLDATMQQFLVSDDEDFLMLTNEIIFEIANRIGFIDPFTQTTDESLVN